MRLIGAASIVFALAFTFAAAEFPPALTASQTASRSDDGDRHDRDRDRDDDERKRRKGQAIFRYDTFGDEQLWTDVLRMHEVVAKVPPATALAVGLKVDVEALPRAVKAALRAGEVDLTNPAVTVELLRLNVVVGVQGKVNDLGQLTSVGITCALCHSSVDNSFAQSAWSRGRPTESVRVMRPHDESIARVVEHDVVGPLPHAQFVHSVPHPAPHTTRDKGDRKPSGNSGLEW